MATRRRGGAITFRFDIDAAIASLLYLADKEREVTEFDKYKAGKLLFLADKYHVVRYGRPIFGDVYFALAWGPIPSNLLHAIDAVIDDELHFEHAKRLHEAISLDRSYENPRIQPVVRPNLNALSASDQEALEYAAREHGKKSFEELMALTHRMAAYRKKWESRPKNAKRAVMNYEDFFEEDAHAVAGVKDEMIENAELRKHFPAS